MVLLDYDDMTLGDFDNTGENEQVAYFINYYKTMSIKVIRYRLPSYWACPLINDDYTGLTDEECEEIQRFLEAAEGYPVDVDLETQGFYRCNDAGTLPGECADFIFHKCND